MPSIELKTPRGAYLLVLVREAERLPEATLLTVSAERRDGIEKFALRFRIAVELLDPEIRGELDAGRLDSLLRRLAGYLEHDFETVRENALKSVRGERKLLEITFDQRNPGTFRA